MSFYNFWILRKICLVPLYHLIQEAHHTRQTIPQAAPQTILHKTKRTMINNQLKIVLGMHYELVGQEKILNIRFQRRATHW